MNLEEKKQQVCKPGSVLYLHKAFVIYLEQMSPFASSNLPPDIGRATLHASVYVILQPIRRTALNVATQTGELLPHLFTLTPKKSKRLFSVTLLCSHKQFPVRKYGALRCPDFPPFHKGKATNRPTILLQR
jgi:hypothetical protein